jgi:hypothetical protein
LFIIFVFLLFSSVFIFSLFSLLPSLSKELDAITFAMGISPLIILFRSYGSGLARQLFARGASVLFSFKNKRELVKLVLAFTVANRDHFCYVLWVTVPCRLSVSG